MCTSFVSPFFPLREGRREGKGREGKGGKEGRREGGREKGEGIEKVE